MNRVRKIFLGLCLFNSVFASTQFLVISDIHYGSDNPNKMGSDTGTKLLAIALEKYKELSKKVDFILMLGDLPSHLLTDPTKKGEYEKAVFHGLYAGDQNAKPLFYITGNNDPLGGNYQAFETNGLSPLNFASEWTGACAHCEGLLIDDSHMKHDGYYSAYVQPDNKEIMLIALNTVQFNKRFILSPYPNQDQEALEQLHWLEQQLKSHQAKQLLIAMHIPPGTNYLGFPFWNEEYLQKFINLLQDYHHLYGEISLLTAHTHMDALEKITLTESDNIYVYFTPGVSRVHFNNPGMKIFTLDGQMAMKNYTTYYTTSMDSWGHDYYQAIGAKEAIFPNCENQNLAQCLNSLSAEQVCDDLEGGLFFGVKSSLVTPRVCLRGYLVN